jgi:hypothetical protein
LGTAAAAKAPAGAGQRTKSSSHRRWSHTKQGTGYQLARTAPLLNRGRPSVLWGVSWFPTWPSCRGTQKAGGCHQCVVLTCASAGAERRGGVLCAGPAHVVTPQGKASISISIPYLSTYLHGKKKRRSDSSFALQFDITTNEATVSSRETWPVVKRAHTAHQWISLDPCSPAKAWRTDPPARCR